MLLVPSTPTEMRVSRSSKHKYRITHGPQFENNNYVKSQHETATMDKVRRKKNSQQNNLYTFGFEYILLTQVKSYLLGFDFVGSREKIQIKGLKSSRLSLWVFGLSATALKQVVENAFPEKQIMLYRANS